MKALFSFLSCLIMLALFTRCADDELDGPSDGLPDKGLVVRLSTGGGLETKTTLNSTGAYHHVKEVWAVLYKLDASGNSDNLNDYTYISHQRLMVNETTPWDPYGAEEYDEMYRPDPDDEKFNVNGFDKEAYDNALREHFQKLDEQYGGSYGNGNLQQKDFELSVDPDGVTLPPATYRVLCIGLDEESKTLYGLKKDENNLSDIFAEGNTLADAVATIQSGVAVGTRKGATHGSHSRIPRDASQPSAGHPPRHHRQHRRPIGKRHPLGAQHAGEQPSAPLPLGGGGTYAGLWLFNR